MQRAKAESQNILNTAGNEVEALIRLCNCEFDLIALITCMLAGVPFN